MRLALAGLEQWECVARTALYEVYLEDERSRDVLPQGEERAMTAGKARW